MMPFILGGSMSHNIKLAFQLLLLAHCIYAQSSAATAPVCGVDKLASRVGPYGGAMGSQYTELIFKNTSKTRCSLDVNKLVFWRMNPKPGGTQDKNSHMPTRVFRGPAVNMDGAGSVATVLDPAQETAVTMETANRTGYDEQHVCATKIRVALSGESKPLLDFDSISCEERMFVSGFHTVRQ
jgi:hypothetical protein